MTLSPRNGRYINSRLKGREEVANGEVSHRVVTQMAGQLLRSFAPSGCCAHNRVSQTKIEQPNHARCNTLVSYPFRKQCELWSRVTTIRMYGPRIQSIERVKTPSPIPHGLSFPPCHPYHRRLRRRRSPRIRSSSRREAVRAVHHRSTRA